MERDLVVASPTSAMGPPAAATPASAAAFAHRPGFVHHQCSSQEILAVAGLNRSIGFGVVGEFRESETPGLSGELVANNLDRISMKSGLREEILQFGLAGLVGKVANKQFLQESSFSVDAKQRTPCLQVWTKRG